MRRASVFLVLLLMGCGESIDTEFDRSLQAQLADPLLDNEARENVRRIMTYKEHLSDDEKRQFIDAYQAMKEAQAAVEATEEEGRRLGYVKD